VCCIVGRIHCCCVELSFSSRYAFHVAVSIITEYFFWQERTASRIPWRTIYYLVISIYQFWTLPTALSGVCCILTAFVNFCSERHEEEVTLAEKDQPITKLVAWCRPELTDSSATAGQRAAGSGGAGRYAADADEDRKQQQQLGEDASCCDRIVDYYMQLRYGISCRFCNASSSILSLNILC
jgi:hypothetical protein